MKPREWVRVLVKLSAANPLFGLGLVTLIVAIALWIGRVVFTVSAYMETPLVARVHAEEYYEDENGFLLPCPWLCSLIDYQSVTWYATCWPLPRQCSANPVPFTLQSVAPAQDPNNSTVIENAPVMSRVRVR